MDRLTGEKLLERYIRPVAQRIDELVEAEADKSPPGPLPVVLLFTDVAGVRALNPALVSLLVADFRTRGFSLVLCF